MLVNEDAPFVMFEDNGEITGFSVDLWREIARRLKLESVIEDEPVFAQMLERVVAREADLAIANISITAEREARLDFSQPYFDSGMQILLRIDGAPAPSFLRAVWESPAPTIAGLGLLALLAVAHVIWAFERRTNASIRETYLGGVWDAFWWAFISLTTGGGERPEAVATRILAMVWVLLGLLIVSSVTAGITTWLTVQQLSGGVSSYRDLTGMRVGLSPGTTHARFAEERGLPYLPYRDTIEILEALQAGDLDATIIDAPVAQYFARNEGAGVVTLAGPVFAPDKYGIAFPDGSPLREPVNQQLLAILEDGTFRRLHRRYFGGEEGR
ncbi:MAG: transporter substrate-binding domain-containing protein [Pseudomonadota bacterium]